MYFNMIDYYQIISSNEIYSVRGLSMTEAVFDYHFPNFPILPGVLMLEMCTQSIEHLLDYQSIGQIELKSISKVRFIKFARPGDVLATHIKLREQNDKEYVFEAMIKSNDKKIAIIKSIAYGISK